MKIGILTLHSQLNYGAILQCLALQSVLQELGHNVFILDRWLQTDNRSLWEDYHKITRKNVLRLIGGLGTGKRWKRIKKTNDFIEEFLNLTPYHFVHWDDFDVNQLDFDLIIVGSDQVWNSMGDLDIYLVDKEEIKIPLISYAASIGNSDFSEEQLLLLKRKLKEFQAISVREDSAKKFLQDIGIVSERVLDPVFLMDKAMWQKKVKLTPKSENKLVCYFMESDIDKYFIPLIDFSEKNKCDIEIFVNSYCFRVKKTISSFIKSLRLRLKLKRSRVSIRFEANPLTFVQSFFEAKYVLTDSFHGTAFATIFQKKLVVLKPCDSWRISMFSRIEETCRRFYPGCTVIYSEISEALDALKKNDLVLRKDALLQMTGASLTWLKDSISAVIKNR